MIDPVTMTANGEARSIWESTPNPIADITRPAAISWGDGIRREIAGTIMDPRTNAPTEGSDHRPALSGDMPSTSCRYWAMKTSDPNAENVASKYVASAVLKVADRKSRRSIKGCASRGWRRTNRIPTATPATTDIAATSSG